MDQGVSGAPVAVEIHATGRRVLATIVDGVVLAVVVSIMAFLFGSTTVEGGQASASLSGLPALFSFVLAFGYYILMGGYLGQTLGKMLLGIKVVREDSGGVPGLKAAIRIVLRLVDGFLSYLVAFGDDTGLAEEPASRRYGRAHPGRPQVGSARRILWGAGFRVPGSQSILEDGHRRARGFGHGRGGVW